MNQPSLWDAYAHKSDPDTSHEAARSVNVPELESRVLQAIVVLSGATSKEVAAYLEISPWSVSPRFRPLERKGLIEKTGERRAGSNVYRAT